MFYLGINDILLMLCICFFAGWVFAVVRPLTIALFSSLNSLQGEVYCHHPKLHFAVCMFAFGKRKYFFTKKSNDNSLSVLLCFLFYLLSNRIEPIHGHAQYSMVHESLWSKFGNHNEQPNCITRVIVVGSGWLHRHCTVSSLLYLLPSHSSIPIFTSSISIQWSTIDMK